jgi:ankyrin repeat protein
MEVWLNKLGHWIPNLNAIRQDILLLNGIIKEPIDGRQRYILHYACLENAPSSFVEQLIKVYPPAAREKDQDGCYPLLYAITNFQSNEVIQLLLQEYPVAVHHHDKHGWYPLHYACQNNFSEEVIRMLITEYPMAVRKQVINRNDSWSCSCPFHESIRC